MRVRIAAFLFPLYLMASVPLFAQDSPVIGEVDFSTSCDASVDAEFDRAVALLHSFEFAQSKLTFQTVSMADPACAMGHWGVAMTHYHPLWAPPTAADLKAGSAAVHEAQALASLDREAAYIEAIATFYRDYETLDHRTRAIAYEKAMENVQAAHPNDPEAAIFHQLAVLSNADPTDKTYALQQQTGAFFEAMFVQMPDHPGLAHYIIHSYDYPPLSSRAVEAAHRYLEIAPDLAHAVHMSGHIFTQEGMWEASIDANTHSVSNARESAKNPETLVQAQLGEMHSLDYMVYAFLQEGRNEAAREIVEHIASYDELHWENGVVSFNAGAVPVRYAMERHAWDEAASLPDASAGTVGSAGYESRATVAMRHWARAVGAARSGDIEKSRVDLAVVAQIAEESRDEPNVWFRNTAQVLRLEAEAWLALAQGDDGRALDLMHAAAALEDQTDKSGLSPGRVLPVHEQLGDLLMELRRPDEAMREYEVSLTHAARRLNSHYGLARAARQAGQPDVAKIQYRLLLELTVPDSPRPEVAEARAYLAAED